MLVIKTRVRDDGRWRDAGALLLLFAVVVQVLSAPLLRPGRTIVGEDLGPPFNWEAFNRATLAQGKLPLWNPHVFSGIPGIADIQTRFFYLPDVLLRGVPLTDAFNYAFIFHLWLAAAGTYALCRQIRTSRWAAILAALGFALGGAFTPRLYPVHVLLIWSIAWLPLILALCLRSIQSGRWMPSPSLPIVLAIQVLAGYIQGSIYVVGVIVLFYVFHALSRRSRARSSAFWRLPFQLCLVGLVSGGLTAAQLIPTARLVGEAGRAEGISYEAATRDSLSWAHLTTLVFPNALADQSTAFREEAPGGMWEKSGYVGLVLLLAAPLSLTSSSSRRKALFWVAIAMLGLGFALGKNLPLFEFHYALMPGLRNPGRLLPLWSLGLAVMGALGVDRVLQQGQYGARPMAASILMAIPAITAVVAGALTLVHGPNTTVPGDQTLMGTGAWLLILVGAAWFIALMSGARWRRSLVPLVLLAVTLLDLIPFARQFIVAGRPSQHDELEVALRQLQPARVLSLCPEEVAGNDMMQIGVGGIDGYSGVFLADYARFAFLARGEHVPASHTTFPSIGRDGLPSRMDLISLLNVTHVLNCGPLRAPQFERIDRIGRVQIYANRDVLPRGIWTCDIRFVSNRDEAVRVMADPAVDLSRTTLVLESHNTARVYSALDGCSADAAVSVQDADHPDGLVTLTTDSSTSGVLFLSEPFYPERKATVDGQDTTVLRANLAFSAIPLGAGRHTVELRYVPTTLYAGAAISILTVVIWVIAITTSFLRAGDVPGKRRE
jgi:hypothetical protein